MSIDRTARYHDPMRSRPRRNRKSIALRAVTAETELHPSRFLLPLFVHGGRDNEPIPSMPGCERLSNEGLYRQVEGALSEGITSVVLFPKVAEELKTPKGEESKNANGLIPITIRRLKERWPELVVVTDVALDPYSSTGHDGIVSADGRILNDETVEALVEQALCQARAGANVIAPSDMMDGRIGAIRDALDAEGFQDISILAYTAKYASAFYGPFRDALDSAPKGGTKETYQMDPRNVREALREVELDVAEGADAVMVKPAGPYLDVIRAVREATHLPVAAYQVSGEYAMLKAAAQAGWLDERATVLESLMAIRRAGADWILTYFARDAARWLA